MRGNDRFVVNPFLTDSLAPHSTLYFPVVQECEQGVSRWIEIPAKGEPSHEGKRLAPGVELLPKHRASMPQKRDDRATGDGCASRHAGLAGIRAGRDRRLRCFPPWRESSSTRLRGASRPDGR